MQNQIKHFIHEHPMTLQEYTDHEPCLICRQKSKIPSQMYSCYEKFCLGIYYQIHAPCANLQQEMAHPFHRQQEGEEEHSLTFVITPPNASVSFKCNACGPIPRSSNYYHCSECGFYLDVCCASLMPTKIRKAQEQQIQHLGHPHPLILCDNKTIFEFPCSGCRQTIDGSQIYVCLHCNCLLDESCARWPSQIEHPLHPQHPLTLLVHQTWDSASDRCSACGKVLVGFTFHCSECNFSLDPCCASLMPLPPRPTPTQNSRGRDDNEEEFQIQQLSHSHPLIPCEKTKGYRISCDACRLLVEDSVVYICTECKFLLHKSCADLPLEVKHSFCHQHTLTLIEYSFCRSEGSFDTEKQFIRAIRSGKAHEFEGRLLCYACNRFALGFTYVCPNPKCEILFDIKCPLWKPWLINSEIHQHPLAFFTYNELQIHFSCTACEKYIYYPFFRCVECNFNLHVFCVPTLPPTAKSEHHRHPLTLTNSHIRDHPGEKEGSEFYCDACEKTRQLDEPTYYCEECHFHSKFVAHVHCLHSEILPKLGAYKFEETNLETSASGCEELVEEEEGVELDSHAGADKVDMSSSSSAAKVSSVEASKTDGSARVDGDSFLIELDKEIVVLRSKIEWLAKKLMATKHTMEEVEGGKH